MAPQKSTKSDADLEKAKTAMVPTTTTPAGAAAPCASLSETGFLTAADVKRRYRISSSTLYKWIADGHLPPPLKIGPRAVRWSLESLAAFEASLPASK